ncbi:MAG: GDSL-type esterase/lipase family protein [Phycisphaerae bacterium]
MRAYFDRASQSGPKAAWTHCLARWVCVCLSVGLAVPVEAELKLTDADRVLFFGATPFWPATYSARVETFLRVKYPALKTRFWHWAPPQRATTADAGPVLGRHLQAFKPTLVVLNFGLHHGHSEPLRPARLEQFRGELLDLIEVCRQAGAKVVLVTPSYPEADKKLNLQQARYDQVVGAYADAVRKIGQELDLDVVDWFTAASDHAQAMKSGQAPVEKLTIDGITPAPLGSAIGAEQVLSYLGAEPLTVELSLDWAAAQASTTAGDIQVVRRSDTTVALGTNNLPVPWCVSGRGRRVHLNRPGSAMCRYQLRIENLPPGDVLISRPGGKGVTYSQSTAARGIDLTFSKALIANQAVAQLLERIKYKNLSADHFERMLRKPALHPEYAESNEMFLKALTAEAEAGAKVVDRTDRTMTVVLEIEHQPGATGKTDGGE